MLFFSEKNIRKDVFYWEADTQRYPSALRFLLANYTLLNASSRGRFEQDHLIKNCCHSVALDGFSVLVKARSDNYGIMEPSLF